MAYLDRVFENVEEAVAIPNPLSFTGPVVINGGGSITLNPNGNIYFVDANASSGGDGSTWAKAFRTMAAAFAVLASGDTIFFRGKIREQLTTPVQVFDVTIVGAGNRPRHADSTPAGGEIAANSWTVPTSPAATTPCVKVLQQGWRFVNVLFYSHTDAASILLYRDGGSGNAERDASHAEILGCRFASGRDGVEQSGGCFNVKIDKCVFMAMSGYAIKHTAGAGIAAPLQWEITNNRFLRCANWMGTWDAHNFKITGNEILETTTLLINTGGGTYNTIVGNTFSIAAADFDPTGNVTGDATDVWSNTLIDSIETGLPAD